MKGFVWTMLENIAAFCFRSRQKISATFAFSLLLASCILGCGGLGLGLGLRASQQSAPFPKYNISKIVKERKLRQSTDLKFFAWAICNGEIPYSATEGFEQEALRILQTIENRAEHCGTTIADTITRQAQFSFLNSSKKAPDGPEIRFDKKNMARFVECENKAVEIMLGPREVWTANFYHATNIPRPKWAEKMRLLGESGGHIWYQSEDRNYCESEKQLPTIWPQGQKTVTTHGFLIKRLKQLTGDPYIED